MTNDCTKNILLKFNNKVRHKDSKDWSNKKINKQPSPIIFL